MKHIMNTKIAQNLYNSYVGNKKYLVEIKKKNRNAQLIINNLVLLKP